MRHLKKISLYTLASIIFLLLLSIILVQIYKGEIKKYAVEHMNSYLDAEVNVQDIELTLFDKFPSAALNFNNVFIKDPYINDTLIYAQNLYLEFNLFGMIAGEYSINEIDVEKGSFYLKVDSLGRENYRFWKENVNSSSSEKFSFDLENVNLYDTKIHYQNANIKQQYHFFTDALNLSGTFSEDSYNLSVNAGLQIELFQSKNVIVLQDKIASLNLNLLVDNPSKTYSLKQSELKIEDMLFDVDGQLNNQNKAMACNIQVKGKNIDIASILSSFSGFLFEEINNYESEGSMDFDASIVGEISNSNVPKLKAEFSIADGYIREKNSNIQLKGIELIGSFTNKSETSTELLILKKANAVFRDGTFSAKASISDFTMPHLIFDLSGDLNLRTIHEFLQVEKIEKIDGRTHFSCSYDGKLLEPKNINNETLHIHSLVGRIDLENASFKLQNQPKSYNDISGTFILNKNDAALRDLSLSIGNSDFAFNGSCENFTSFILFPKQKLNIIASLESKTFNLSDIMSSENADSEQKNDNTIFNLPENINFTLNGKIGRFNYDRFIAENTSCQLKLVDQQLTTQIYRLDIAGGKLNGNFTVDGRSKEKFIVSSNINTSQLNISSLFYQFKNFGQSVISDKKIKGTFTANTQFSAILDKQLNFINEKTYCTSDLSITNGELIELETMKAITDYMKEGKAIKVVLKNHINDLEKRLSHIQFAKLNNQIVIKNQTVYIPKMKISSSAMDLELEGTHNFDNQIEYGFIFDFRDLKKKNEYTEFGKEIDDDLGMRIFLSMNGTTDDPSFKWNKESQQASRKEKLLAEKQTFKSTLKQEFGLFKTDTTLSANPTNKKEEVEFQVYGGELNDENDSQKNLDQKEIQRNKRKTNRFFNKWNSKDSGTKDQFEIDDDDF